MKAAKGTQSQSRQAAETLGDLNVLDEGSRKGVWIASFIIAAIVALAVYPLLAKDVVNPDPPIFALAAKRLLAGQRLYRDFFEAKPPLATLAYAIPGWIAPRSYLALQYTLAIVLLIQGGLWFWAFRPRPLTGAVCLLFVVFFPLSFWDFSWLSTEHLSNVFIAVNLLVALGITRDGQITWRRCCAAGVATCLAFHFRQNTLLSVLVPLFAVAVARQAVVLKLKGLLWIVAGGLASWAVILLLVGWVADYPGYFDQVFIFPARFAQSGGMEERLLLFWDIADSALPAMVVVAAVLAMFSPQRWLALVALGVGLLSCTISPRPNTHYWVNCFPAVTLCFLLGLPRNRPTTLLREAAALTIVAGAVILYDRTNLAQIVETGRVAVFDQVVQRVDQLAMPNDTLYVYGPQCSEYIPFRAKLLPAQKYTIGWEMDWNDGMVPESADQIIQSYLLRPPTLFLMHYSYQNAILETISGTAPSPTPSARLAAALLTSHQYRLVDSVAGYCILRIIPDSAPGGDRTTLNPIEH